MSDAINPQHYKRLLAEAIEIIEAAIDNAPSNQAALLHGQVLKYILRCWDKNGIEDLRKAKWYLDRLIESFDESEPEQPKPTLNSDKIPEGYRKLKDSSIEPRQRGDLRWSVAEKRYIEIGFDEIGYANRDNWAACRKITEEVDTEWVDAVWPQDWGKPARFWPNPIYQDEGTPDHELWDLGTVAGYTADGYRKWLIEMDGKISCQMYCQVKKNAGTLEQATQPPDGWRFLERGEVIRKGDKPINGIALRLLWVGTPCANNHFILRRNRFEVGEKVVHGDLKSTLISTVKSVLSDGWVDLVRDGVSTAYHVKDLAPYIEDAIPEITEEVTEKVKPPDGWRWLEVGEVIRKGDKYRDLKSQTWIEVVSAVVDSLQDFHKPTIRRNRFEVGEKVVHVNGINVCEVVECDYEKNRYAIAYNGSEYAYESKWLAPYIEETK